MFKLFFIITLFIYLPLLNAQDFNNVQQQNLTSENLLLNGGFESGRTAWTIFNSSSLETSLVIKGKNSLKITLSNQTLNLIQDSTKYASQLDEQGIATIRIKTTSLGVKLCSRRAGITSTTSCVSHSGSGKWELLKVPFTLGTISNGLSISTSGNITGVVYIDDAFIGQFDKVESCSNSYECESTYSAKVSSAGLVSNENIDWINGNCGWASGNATCTFKSGVFTVAPNCSVSGSTGDSYHCGISSSSSTSFIANCNFPNLANNARNFQVVCQKQGVDYVGKTVKAMAGDQNTRMPGIVNSKICGFKLSSANVLVSQFGGCMATSNTFVSGYWTEIPSCTVIGGNENASIGSRMETLTLTTIQAASFTANGTGVATSKNFICAGY